MNSFFMLWIMMEINTLMIFILMFMNKTNKIKMMMYMLIQAFSSSSMLMFMFLKSLFLNYYLISNLGMMMSLSMKLGFFPFHMWYPYINSSFKWIIIYFMFTTQKISPIILSTNIKYMNLFMLIIMLNSIISSMNMFYSNNYKYIMSYSSLIHSSWLIIILTMSNKNFINYLIFYLIITSMLLFMFNKLNIIYINQYSLIKNFNNMILYMLMLSYSSLPPFSGFYTKWISIMEFNYLSFFSNCFLILSSINAMFMYLKIMLPMSMMLKNKK
uniref:NADH-ubiquinone oxidoreductase chain 2 n=1 Tax=Ammophila sabulosa TaxID=1088610 RepID=A0A7L7S8X4_9HYME|nr:NADH dehydrogenase subunit 2 [Ammophila sabulosa]